MPSSVILKALGLNTSPNHLDNNDGHLLEAINVIIRRDNVIESRRGYKLYGTEFGTSTDRTKQLLTYKQRIIRHYNDVLQFDTKVLNTDGESIFSNFNGSYTEPEVGRRIRSIESNGNLYITTNDGIKKISATNASEFTSNSSYITNAGGVKAIDFETILTIEPGDQSSFFEQNSTIAYRNVWGIKDVNSNLILGSPSQRNEVYNPLLNLLIYNTNQVLGALDNINQTGSQIRDGDYVANLLLVNTSSASELRTNLIALAEKLDQDIVIANSTGTNAAETVAVGNIAMSGSTAVVTPSAGAAPNTVVSIGDKINIVTAYTMTTGTIPAGQYTITNVTLTTFSFEVSPAPTGTNTNTAVIESYNYRNIPQPIAVATPPTTAELVSIQDYLDLIISRLQEELTGIISLTLSNLYIIPLDITTTASVTLRIRIPEDVTADHFLQIYRTSLTTAIDTDVLDDLNAGDEMAQVYEAYPTEAELTARIMVVEDVLLDSFRGTNLYTNAVTGEGILQSNDIPPLAKDINQFKNVIFYANTQTRQRELLSLLGVLSMISDYNLSIIPQLTITTSDSQFNTYRFIVGLQEKTDLTFVAELAGNYTGTYFTLNSANDERDYYFWYYVSGSGVDPTLSGKTGIRVVINTGDTANTIANKTLSAIEEQVRDFSAAITVLPTIRVTNVDVGYTTDASINTSPISIIINQQGIGELVTRESTNFNTVAGGTLNIVGAGNYFTLNSAFNQQQYYVWYQVGVSTDPVVANKTGIQVTVLVTDTATQIATKTAIALNAITNKFNASSLGSVLTVQNYDFGPALDATTGTMPGGFTLTVTQQGALDVLLSSNESPAQAVDETSRSLVRVINTNISEILYAYYLSGATDVPGKMLLEARALSTPKFYTLANNNNTGASFNPNISPEFQITNISIANPTVITTSTPHGLIDADTVVISNTNSTPSIDGVWVVTTLTSTTFSINKNVLSIGSLGAMIKASSSIFSENELQPHRIYYSKLQQPEAVPLLNYFDIGSQDKAILRILPLRDSLFVLKEDGIYRISGEISPFTVGLFDSSVCIAADSADLASSLIYFWETQGIAVLSESGVSSVSRKIDVDLLEKASSEFINFKTATFGVGYDSDSAYLVWTVDKREDEIATICYRYCNLTDTWTTFDKTNTCGIINDVDDKMYLGAGDTNYIEQERKSFNRLDYADREIHTSLTTNNYLLNGQQIRLTSVSNITIGDVLYQSQYVTAYEFNQLLKKLDIDPGVNDTNYYSILGAEGGDDLRDKLKNSNVGFGLAAKLDVDTGVADTDYLNTIIQKTGSLLSNSIGAITTITTTVPHGLVDNRIVQISGSNSTPNIDGIYEINYLSPTTFSIPFTVNVAGTSGSFVSVDTDFRDIKACYNKLITKLNADVGLAFGNYLINQTTSEYEAIITAVNKGSKIITLNLNLPYVIGPLTVFNHIDSYFRYSPIHMGDPLGLKNLIDATVMFENKGFTTALLSFASDLLPRFTDVIMFGTGNGLFGNDVFGDNYFGGGSHQAPFRTYIPRDAKRCRFLNIAFTHAIAREQYAIFGLTITGEVGQSARAYR